MGDKSLLLGTIEWVYWDVKTPDDYVWDPDDWDWVKVALLLPADTIDVDTYTDWITAEIVTGEQAVRILADTVTTLTTLGNYRARIWMEPTVVSTIAEHPFYEATGRVVVRAG